MKIESIDLFYFALPDVCDIADGSQDSFIVRIRSDTGLEGYGESDSSPLVAFATFVTPASHSNIVALRESLIGQTLDGPDDVGRVFRHVHRRAMDIAQFPHAYSAADIALWDLLGKHLGRPVYELVGYDRVIPKQAYASVLFQDTPEQTKALAAQVRSRGFTAAKFGWGPMGQHGEAFDIALVRAAREGMADGAVMVDAGIAWGDDDKTAAQRARAFAEFDITWLEEPLNTEAVEAYGRLSAVSPVPIAGGEGCNRVREAEDMLMHGGLSFLQIDPGRVGGITPSLETLRLAKQHGAMWVNHTFKSRISLAAAMAVYAGEDKPHAHWLEYCESGSPLIDALTEPSMPIDADGMVTLAATPGIGVTVTLDRATQFSRHVEINIDRKTIGASPEI